MERVNDDGEGELIHKVDGWEQWWIVDGISAKFMSIVGEYV